MLVFSIKTIRNEAVGVSFWTHHMSHKIHDNKSNSPQEIGGGGGGGGSKIFFVTMATILSAH